MLRAMNRSASLDDQVRDVQENMVYVVDGQPRGFRCFLTADGKGMQSTNFATGKKCWLCDDVTLITPTSIAKSVRYGAFLGSIPPRRRIGDFVHCTARVANCILHKYAMVKENNGTALFHCTSHCSVWKSCTEHTSFASITSFVMYRMRPVAWIQPRFALHCIQISLSIIASLTQKRIQHSADTIGRPFATAIQRFRAELSWDAEQLPLKDRIAPNPTLFRQETDS